MPVMSRPAIRVADLLIGLAVTGLANAGLAQANNPAPCPSPSNPLSSVTSTTCQTVQQVTGQASGTAHKTVQNLGKTVQNLTGTSSGSGSSSRTSSGGTSAAGGSTASGSSAHRSLGGTQRHAHRSAAASPAAAGIASATIGVLSPLGIPGWLLTSGPGTLSPVQLNFPTVYPARQAAARAARHSGKAPSRLWVVVLIGAVGLVGGAGGHFLGWPGLRHRARTTI